MKKKLKQHSRSRVTLADAFGRLIARKEEDGKSRTAENYRSTVNKLKVYLGDTTDKVAVGEATYGKLAFGEITTDWVAGFAGWLEEAHPGKPQTADFYFRNLRAMYNTACTEYDTGVSEGYNPFRKIVFREKPSAKRALVKEETEKLLDPAFREEVAECLCESLDILLFILFMRGMVFQDVYNLTWGMIDADNHVHYLRSKTKVPIDTEIPSEARTIMERYRSPDSLYVFPFLHRYKGGKNEKELSEQSALRRVNRHAHRIGNQAGLPILLSTYVMRHTFATLMLEAAKPVELISQCLGHASIRTTQRYLSRLSVTRVDKEVNDMFDRMLRPVTTKVKKNNKGRPKKKTKIESKKERNDLLHKNVPFFIRKRQCLDKYRIQRLMRT